MKEKCWILFSCFILILAIITGCEDAPDLDNGEDDEAGFFAVSDGEYPDRIVIDWGVINETLADEIMQYRIERSEDNNLSYSLLDTCWLTNYEDKTVIPGVIYFYRVKEVYYDDTTSFYSEEDSGFAMNAQILPIGSSFAGYSVNGTAGPQKQQWVWFKILAQKGWTYSIETFEESVPVDTYIDLFKDPVIDFSVASNDDINYPSNLYSQIEYTFPVSQIYYIKVTTVAPGSPFNITIWHH